jgi:phosphate starvation-inducible PhoH-like protein
MFNLIKFSTIFFLSNKFLKHTINNNIFRNNHTCLYNKIQSTTKLFSKKKDITNENELIKKYNPKTLNQKNYFNSLKNNNIDLLFCLGPAGTGKTLFACQEAIQKLQSNTVSKIVITRPTIAIEENMGFLPGDIKNKMHPWTIPIFDIFEEYYSRKDINSMITNNIIEIAPLGFMQGRTFKNSIIIADEMQNSTPNQMFMLLTRIGDNSKMIITGDPAQTINENNGLSDIVIKLNNKYSVEYEMVEDNINIIKMNSHDIQRHHIVSKISKLYKD